MPWKSAMREPNCLRSWRYGIATLKAPSARPSICAAMPTRPSLRSWMAIMYPLPSWPSTSSCGTLQSTKLTSHVEDARIPNLFSFLPMMTPGLSPLTMKAVMPRYPASGLMFANTRNQPACMAFVIQHLVPFRTQPLSVRVARVFRAKASEPLPVSDRQNEPSVSVASFGRYFCFCSSVPNLRTEVASNVFWTSAITDTPGSTLASSSITMQEEVKLMFAPLYSAGISTPMNPWSNKP
mmetsp:Transcript_10278/g.23436  ORF Transcript_10278/g.23436 Transcript_10278/m.23436 type:complete len:238 (-) Transcript_10278:225-938(-)